MLRGNEFTWVERSLAGGIRQDVAETAPRYRLVQNFNWKRMGPLAKDLGVRRLNSSQVDVNPTYGGLEVRFDDGSGATDQYLVLFQSDGAKCQLQVFDSATRTFILETVDLDDHKPCGRVFANKLNLFDGTGQQTWDGTTVAAISSGIVDACTFAVVYANRLIAFGDPANPYYFYPSAVRDSTSGSAWDAALAYEVTSPHGEAVLGAGTCGSWLIVGGNEFLRAFSLGEASPRDWSMEVISDQIGPVNWQSFVEVARPRGNAGSSFAFFWTPNGPAMVLQQSRSVPVLVPLWEPLRDAVQGIGDDYVPAFNRADYANVEGSYDPMHNEVRFVLKTGEDTTRSTVLALHVDSAIRYASDPDRAYPYWRLRTNDVWPLPAHTIFSCEVDTAGLPSLTGQVKTFIATDGWAYEMDARDDSLDDGSYEIAARTVRAGVDGAEDGVDYLVKSVRGGRLRATLGENNSVTVTISADDASDSSSYDVDLTGSLNMWDDRTAEGTWGDGNPWNAPGTVEADIHLGCLGRMFTVQMDATAATQPLELMSYTLYGMVEGDY